MKSRIYLREKVANKDRKFGALVEYYPVAIIVGGNVRPALFTRDQVCAALARAEMNPEDMPPVHSFWRRVREWLR